LKGKSLITIILAFLVLSVMRPSASFAQEHEVEEQNSHSTEGHSEEKEFDPGTFILEHIADSHEWHIYTDRQGNHKSVYLPVILYDKEKGISVFSSKHLAHGHVYNGYKIVEEGDNKGRIAHVDDAGHIIEGSFPLDFSITKIVFAMMLSAVVLLWLFIGLARS